MCDRVGGKLSSSHARFALLPLLLLALCASNPADAGAQAGDGEVAVPPKGAAPSLDGKLPALRFAIDDANPEGQVPTPEQANGAPLDMGYWVMAVSDRAEAAIKRGDHVQAGKYFKALVKAVPDTAVAFSRLCRELRVSGDAAGALDACRSALGKKGVTVDDHVQFAHLLLQKGAPLAPSEVGDIEAIAAHLETQLNDNSTRLTANQLRCELALRLSDKVKLQSCVRALDKLAANDPRTITFGMALALQDRDLTGAEALIERAKQSKLPATAIEQMQSALRAEREKRPSWMAALQQWSIPGLAALVAAVVVVFALGGRRTRKLGPA